MNSKTELFLNKYRELESIVSAEHDLKNSESAVGFLLRRPEYRSIKSELEYCREVRNLLSHNPKVRNEYAVEPSGEMIALLNRTIERVRNPQRARHVCIPKEKISCRTMDDHVLPAMIEMNERVYTHIPIVRDGVVIGVFSENTLLSYLIDNEIVSIGKDVRFRDIAKYLPIDQHRAETFRFISQNTPVSEIEEIFANALKKAERIGLIFVTRSGKPAEKLLGIISAWDIAAID